MIGALTAYRPAAHHRCRGLVSVASAERRPIASAEVANAGRCGDAGRWHRLGGAALAPECRRRMMRTPWPAPSPSLFWAAGMTTGTRIFVRASGRLTTAMLRRTTDTQIQAISPADKQAASPLVRLLAAYD